MMWNGVIKYIVVFFLGVLATLFVVQRNKVDVKVPVKIEVPIPPVDNDFDPKENPTPIYKEKKVIDTVLLNKFKRANDSLKQALYILSIEENEYREVFEDNFQTIGVYAKTQGRLKELSLGYRTKPRVIEVDTFVKYIYTAKNRGLVVYTEMGIPTVLGEDSKAILKGGVDYINKKNLVLGASYDTDKNVWVKIGYKFNF